MGSVEGGAVNMEAILSTLFAGVVVSALMRWLSAHRDERIDAELDELRQRTVELSGAIAELRREIRGGHDHTVR